VRIPGTHRGLRETFFFFDAQRISIINPLPSSSTTSTVPTLGMRNSNFSNLQDLITGNSGTRTDALGRTFSLGTVFDPSTTRVVQGKAIDPITGLMNGSSSAINVRDPFYTGGSVGGITNFVGRTSQLNILPGSRIDPNAVKLLQLYPAPTSPGVLNNFYYAPSLSLTLNQYDIRIDHNINESNLLWGVFNWYHAVQNTPGRLPGLALGANYGAGFNDSPHWATAFSYTHIFTPTLTNSIHFGYQSTTNNNVPPSGNIAGIPDQYGIQGVQFAAGLGGLPLLQFAPNTSAALTPLGASGYNPVTNNVTSLEILENVTKLYRNHSFSIGYELTQITSSLRQPTAGVGSMTFSGEFSDIPGNSSGYGALADALLTPVPYSLPTGAGLNYQGGVTSFTKSNAPFIYSERWYNAGYFQDDWKSLPNLTLNLGLRYDLYGAPLENNDRQANMIANGGNGPGGTYFMPSSTCNQAPPQFLALLQKDGINQSCISNRYLSDTQKTNFAPRVGFAYRIRSDFVIRAGYGIAYGALANIGAAPYVIGNNFPFAYSVTYTAASPVVPVVLPTGSLPTLENVFAGIDVTNPATVNPEGANLAGRQFNYQTPYTQTFNLTLQKQVGRHDSVQAAYVGDVGRHLDARGTYNVPSQILPPGTNNTANIPFPDFAIGSAFLSTNAESSYNSLQLSYSHELSSGLSMIANYTWSKCMTDQAVITDGLTYRAQWLPGQGISREYTLCPNDATNVVHAAGSYDLPFGKGRQFLGGANPVVQGVLGGWAVNSIYTYQSGQPFTVTCPIQTTSYFGCNANVVPGVNMYAGPHNQHQWLNPKAFTNPPVATQIGQTDYSPLGGLSEQARGPRFYNFDASVFKEFPIREAIHLQFRAEAYNLLNHDQFQNPSTNLDFTNATNFSPITALRNQPRILQFALKLFY
jgi:hypothetical protein